MIKPLPLLVVLLLISPANGMVYSWTDSAGITHFTNKEYEIPQRYRSKVKARYPEQGDSGITPLNVQAPQVEKSVQPQTQPQVLQVNPSVPAKTIQADFPPEHQQMKKERAARNARRNKKAEEE